MFLIYNFHLFESQLVLTKHASYMKKIESMLQRPLTEEEEYWASIYGKEAFCLTCVKGVVADSHLMGSWKKMNRLYSLCCSLKLVTLFDLEILHYVFEDEGNEIDEDFDCVLNVCLRKHKDSSEVLKRILSDPLFWQSKVKFYHNNDEYKYLCTLFYAYLTKDFCCFSSALDHLMKIYIKKNYINIVFFKFLEVFCPFLISGVRTKNQHLLEEYL